MSTPDATINQPDTLLEQERLMEDAAELIAELMQRTGLSQKDIAKRIGKSKGFVSQVLSGRRNMTLRTFSDLAAALGFRIALDATPLSEKRRYRQESVAVPSRSTKPKKSGHPFTTIDAAIYYKPLLNKTDQFTSNFEGQHVVMQYKHPGACAAIGYRRRASEANQYERVA